VLFCLFRNLSYKVPNYAVHLVRRHVAAAIHEIGLKLFYDFLHIPLSIRLTQILILKAAEEALFDSAPTKTVEVSTRNIKAANEINL